MCVTLLDACIGFYFSTQLQKSWPEFMDELPTYVVYFSAPFKNILSQHLKLTDFT